MQAPISCAAMLMASLLSGCASNTSAPYSAMNDPVAQQLAIHNPEALPVYLSARQQTAPEDGLDIPWRQVLNVSVAVVAYHAPMLGLSPSASAFMAMTSTPALLADNAPDNAAPSMDITALLMAQGQQQLQGRINELEQRLAASMATNLQAPSEAFANTLAAKLEAHDLPGGDALSSALTDKVASLSEQWSNTQKRSLDTVLSPKIALIDQYLMGPDNQATNKASLLSEETLFGVTSLWPHPKQ